MVEVVCFCFKEIKNTFLSAKFFQEANFKEDEENKVDKKIQKQEIKILTETFEMASLPQLNQNGNAFDA